MAYASRVPSLLVGSWPAFQVVLSDQNNVSIGTAQRCGIYGRLFGILVIVGLDMLTLIRSQSNLEDGFFDIWKNICGLVSRYP